MELQFTVSRQRKPIAPHQLCILHFTALFWGWASLFPIQHNTLESRSNILSALKTSSRVHSSISVRRKSPEYTTKPEFGGDRIRVCLFCHSAVKTSKMRFCRSASFKRSDTSCLSISYFFLVSFNSIGVPGETVALNSDSSWLEYLR